MQRSTPVKNTQIAPLMIHFKNSSQPLTGLSAWGGKTLNMDRIRSLDLAMNLGAPRPWIETLVQEIISSDARRVVLVNPEYDQFMGDPVKNRDRVFQALAEARITISELKTHSSTPPHSGRLWGRTA